MISPYLPLQLDQGFYLKKIMNLPELWAGKKNGKWLERTNFKKAPPQFLVREIKNIRTCGLSDMEKIFYIRSKLKS